jgi:hypothetical protein
MIEQVSQHTPGIAGRGRRAGRNRVPEQILLTVSYAVA